MNPAALYREQASYCAFLLNRVTDPRRRAQIERERDDWLVLAYEHHLLTDFDAAAASAPAAPVTQPQGAYFARPR